MRAGPARLPCGEVHLGFAAFAGQRKANEMPLPSPCPGLSGRREPRGVGPVPAALGSSDRSSASTAGSTWSTGRDGEAPAGGDPSDSRPEHRAVQPRPELPGAVPPAGLFAPRPLHGHLPGVVPPLPSLVFHRPDAARSETFCCLLCPGTGLAARGDTRNARFRPEKTRCVARLAHLPDFCRIDRE